MDTRKSEEAGSCVEEEYRGRDGRYGAVWHGVGNFGRSPRKRGILLSKGSEETEIWGPAPRCSCSIGSDRGGEELELAGSRGGEHTGEGQEVSGTFRVMYEGQGEI